MMTTAVKETPQEALERIQSGYSKNDLVVIAAFAAQGLDVEPRVDVLTYRAWIGKGRQVQKGEKGLRVTVWIPVVDKESGLPDGVRPKPTALFHVNQTKPIEG